MANAVLGKINRGLKVLYRKKDFFNTDERKMLCSTQLQAFYDYGNNVWYSSLTKPLKTKLQTSQNKIIRYVFGLGNRQHVGYCHFETLRWLSVHKRMDYLKLNLLYNVYHATAPPYMSSQFVRLSDSHGYSTRNVISNFCLPHVKSQGHTSFKFCAIKLWNSLPEFIKSSSTKDSFKFNCKRHLLQVMKKEESSDFVY